MGILELKPGFYFTGALDHDLRVFDIIMYTEFGTTYNSYVLKTGRHTVLFETAKVKCLDDWLAKVGQITPIDQVDYLVVSHTEPDHSGSVERLLEKWDNITAVGTTSVRTLESLTALAWRIRTSGAPDASRVIGQWELYDLPEVFTGREALQVLSDYMVREGIEKLKAATQIMITPLGYRFRIVRNIVTNFHQPKSTLLLLVSAYVGDDWHRIYDYALTHDFRFLSYGDSSLLL